MKPTLLKTLALSALLVVTAAAPAAGLQLTSVLYPERKSIDVPFAVTEIGPKAAQVTAEVEFKDGQSRITIKYKQMQPAVLFAGDITTYSVWAITKDEVFQNLGPLDVVGPKGEQEFSTGQRDFAMIVTAEPVAGAALISNLVILTSGMPNRPEAKATPFVFDRFGGAAYQALVLPGNPSIANLTFAPGGEPIELMRARKLVELGGSIKLAPEATASYAAAKTALEQATNSTGKGGSARVVKDYASRAETLASEAIRLTVRRDFEKALADEAARKKAEKEALESGLATTTAQKAEVEAMLARVEAEKAKVKAERDALEARLGGALSQIMSVRESARGIVMDLGDVLFDVNKATLKEGARESLAKMSGVLLMLPDVNLRIEGFTDSTGTAERNKILSAERARSVYDYLVLQKIDPARMAHAGYGPANPVADNATAEGRAKNRRVEITFARGPIEPTPGGYTAPEAPAAPAKPAKPAKKG
jgi:outer membrane protein OmpA-like peptidoglycan-associated protein